MIPQSISSRLSALSLIAAAELTIDGLALCCFNSGERIWEVAYPRRRQHNLSITIREVLPSGTPVIAAPITHPVDDNVRSFTISLTGGTDAHNAVYPRGGPAADNFVRTAPHNDPHDLGWIIDLAGPEPGHKFIRLLERSESQRDVTLAQLPHSLLFTSKPGDNPDRLSPLSNNHPLGPGSRELGPTNEALGGVLVASTSGEIRFESEPAGSLNIAPLPYDENRRYEIEIINEDSQDGMEVADFIKGDFHFFYDVIMVDGEKQELWAVPRPTALGSPPEGDCNPGLVSTATLRTLIN